MKNLFIIITFFSLSCLVKSNEIFYLEKDRVQFNSVKLSHVKKVMIVKFLYYHIKYEQLSESKIYQLTENYNDDFELLDSNGEISNSKGLNEYYKSKADYAKLAELYFNLMDKNSQIIISKVLDFNLKTKILYCISIFNKIIDKENVINLDINNEFKEHNALLGSE